MSNWVQDYKDPSWYYWGRSNAGDDRNWTQKVASDPPPDFPIPDLGNAGWYYRDGLIDLADVTANWWHDETVADALFTGADLKAVFPAVEVASLDANWGLCLAALQKYNMADPLTQIGMIANIRTETSLFLPVHEYGDAAYFTRMYEGRADLGNTQAGDGARYCGRGFIQLTGRANYRTYSGLTGYDLEANPDLAMDQGIASEIVGLWAANHGMVADCAAKNWPQVRRDVNGGLNGYETFLGAVTTLYAIAQRRGAV